MSHAIDRGQSHSGYLLHRMTEPSLTDLMKIGLNFLGSDLDGKPSKKEEKLAIELTIKQGEIDRLKENLSSKGKKKKKRKR